MANKSPSVTSLTSKQTLIVAAVMGAAGGSAGGMLGFMLGGKAVSHEETTMAQAQGLTPVSRTSDASAAVHGFPVNGETKDPIDITRHETPSAGRPMKHEVLQSTARLKAMSSNLIVRELPPIVTNLAEPATNWIRLQAAIVFNSEELPHPEKTIAELTSDITGYLRTVSLRNLEGADGLRRLQDELSERAAIRSNGKIHEFIVETMVVQ